MRWWFYSIVLLAVLGCGKDAPAPPLSPMPPEVPEQLVTNMVDQDGTEVGINVEGSDIHVRVDNQTLAARDGGSVDIPQNFPKDVYVYPGATVQLCVTEGASYTLLLATAERAPTVLRRYRAELKYAGWVKRSIVTHQRTAVALYRKDKRGITLIIKQDEKGTQLSLTVDSALSAGGAGD